MKDEAGRKAITVMRFNAAQKLMDQYKALPVLIIGITVDPDNPQLLIFSLDPQLDEKEMLTFVDGSQQLLKEQIAKISITNVRDQTK